MEPVRCAAPQLERESGPEVKAEVNAEVKAEVKPGGKADFRPDVRTGPGLAAQAVGVHGAAHPAPLLPAPGAAHPAPAPWSPAAAGEHGATPQPDMPSRVSADAFAALDAQSHPGMPVWIHAGPQRAAAGFEDPALGWVEVRAENAGGGIHAVIVPDSAQSAQVLGAHMQGLNLHLADRHLAIETLRLESGASGQGGTQQGGEQQQRPPAEAGRGSLRAVAGSGGAEALTGARESAVVVPPRGATISVMA